MPTHDYKGTECGTVADSGYGKTEFPPISPEPSREMGRGVGVERGLCRGRGLNRGWAYQGSSYCRQHERRKS